MDNQPGETRRGASGTHAGRREGCRAARVAPLLRTEGGHERCHLVQEVHPRSSESLCGPAYPKNRLQVALQLPCGAPARDERKGGESTKVGMLGRAEAAARVRSSVHTSVMRAAQGARVRRALTRREGGRGYGGGGPDVAEEPQPRRLARVVDEQHGRIRADRIVRRELRTRIVGSVG